MPRSYRAIDRKERSNELMFRVNTWILLLVVFLVGCCSSGCRKKEKPSGEASGSKRLQLQAKTASEKALAGYLDAIIAKDYEKAVEFIDVEEMLQKQTSPSSSGPSPRNADEMKAFLIQMLQRGEDKAGALSYKILEPEITDDLASIPTELYRDDKLVDRPSFALTKRNGQWKLKSSSAVRASMPPVRRGL
jgi:hypothetical protein